MAEERYLKKINTVEEVEEIAEGDTLALIRDGAIKRIPAEKVGGKSGTGGLVLHVGTDENDIDRAYKDAESAEQYTYAEVADAIASGVVVSAHLLPSCLGYNPGDDDIYLTPAGVKRYPDNKTIACDFYAFGASWNPTLYFADSVVE